VPVGTQPQEPVRWTKQTIRIGLVGTVEQSDCHWLGNNAARQLREPRSGRPMIMAVSRNEKKKNGSNQVTEYKVKVAIEYLSSLQNLFSGNSVQRAATCKAT
jgi:hypothetical protein